MKKRKHKLSLYKKSLLAWVIVLFLLSCGAWYYVYNTMKAYENSNVDTYINNVLKDMKASVLAGNSEKYFEIKKVSNKYEKNASLENGYKELFKNSKLSFSKGDEKYKYDLKADDYVFASITLDSSKKETRLAILNYNVWEIKEVESYAKDGFYDYDFYIKDNYKVTINGIEISKDDLKESSKIEELAEGYNYITLPKLNHYKVTGLTVKPKVEVLDASGKKVDVEFKDNTYTAGSYTKVDSMEEANKLLANPCDPLTFAETWSMFMTAEYDTEPGRGLYKVAPYLIEGTKMYTKAKNWATNVDITFTSVHTLDKDAFTGEKVSNIVVYNENAFSADVYLEKNMTLSDRQKRQDVLNERIYFIYYDGAYRVIAMKSL